MRTFHKKQTVITSEVCSCATIRKITGMGELCGYFPIATSPASLAVLLDRLVGDYDVNRVIDTGYKPTSEASVAISC